ncbi:hypothetical protein B0H14DRAFT_2700033 [Mycena olivaceomarginata]|nr:hypothetical protein B0H14DRAFT_2700033 [Mycena olivaceomarginata]
MALRWTPSRFWHIGEFIAGLWLWIVARLCSPTAIPPLDLSKSRLWSCLATYLCVLPASDGPLCFPPLSHAIILSHKHSSSVSSGICCSLHSIYFII